MIPLIRPYIQFGEIEENFRNIFESGILTRGPFVQKLAEKLQSLSEKRFCFPTSSATTALSACLRGLGIRHGDEVIVADFSFPATANVVEEVGAQTVLADVDPDTFNLAPAALLEAMTSKTRAVIAVDAFGNPTGMNEIARICEDRGIFLIEDAACAIGSSENGVPAGGIGKAGCFSFHPRKLLTSGEGGAIMTSDEDLAAALRVKLLHGGVPSEVGMSFIDVGYNYRLPELQAAMIIAQLKNLMDIVARRQKFQAKVSSRLMPHGFIPQKTGAGVSHNVQSLVYQVPEGVSKTGKHARNDLIGRLRAQGVESTLGTYSISSSPYYRSKYSRVCRVSADLQERTITLPCHDGVTPEELCDRLEKCL